MRARNVVGDLMRLDCLAGVGEQSLESRAKDLVAVDERGRI